MPTAELPFPPFRPNIPMNQHGEAPNIQNCSCVQCSEVRRTQARPPIWYPEVSSLYDTDTVTTNDRIFLFRKNNIASYLNQGQNVDNRVETALVVPNRERAQFAPLQTEVRTNILSDTSIAEVFIKGVENHFGYTPTHERAGPLNTFPMVPTLGTSIAESRRRLAGHYLNNPDAYVSIIRLEPSPSGQFQIIITLEMANVV